MTNKQDRRNQLPVLGTKQGTSLLTLQIHKDNKGQLETLNSLTTEEMNKVFKNTNNYNSPNIN